MDVLTLVKEAANLDHSSGRDHTDEFSKGKLPLETLMRQYAGLLLVAYHSLRHGKMNAFAGRVLSESLGPNIKAKQQSLWLEAIY